MRPLSSETFSGCVPSKEKQLGKVRGQSTPIQLGPTAALGVQPGSWPAKWGLTHYQLRTRLVSLDLEGARAREPTDTRREAVLHLGEVGVCPCPPWLQGGLPLRPTGSGPRWVDLTSVRPGGTQDHRRNVALAI